MSETFYVILISVWNFYIILINVCKFYIKILSIWECLYYFNASNKCVHTLIE